MSYESNSIFWIEVEKVVPNPFQPRREFDQDKLKELSDSIRMYGILQPLVVTRREIMSENGAFTSEYELIAGERRLRASKLAGLSQVPVIIRSGDESELMKLELAIIENLQREDLNAVDRALAFKQLTEKFELSHAQVASKVGRSREYVSNSIRLLGLPDTILNSLRSGDISDGHARTLLMLNDRPEEQDVVFREILLKKLSVREVERISRKIATDKVRKKDWGDTDPELIEIEKQFTETFGTRVQIQKTGFGGKLTIDYFEADDLRKLLDMVHNAESVTHGETDTKVLAQVEEATPLTQVEEHVEEPTNLETPEPSEDLNNFETQSATQSDNSDSEEDKPATQFNKAAPEGGEEEEGPNQDSAPTFSRPPQRYSHNKFNTPKITQETPSEAPRASQEQEVPKEDSDTDLYSLKNFSL